MDISIVIPSYREWEWISRTLSSIWWASQHLSAETQIKVFVVINNKCWADEVTLKRNGKTSEFIKTLKIKSPVEKFISGNNSNEISHFFPAYHPNQVQTWLDLCSWNVEITEIDMWSEWKAWENSNVWIARHAWFMEAKTRNDGWIIMSLDADTMISQSYLGIAQEIVSKYNKVLYWPRLSLWFTKDENSLLKVQQNDYLMTLLESLQTDFITWTKGSSWNIDIPTKYKMSLISSDTHFEWCNIVIPSHMYGWDFSFPPISWEEDTNLCNALINWGFSPVYSEKLIVLTQDRFSDRTSTWDWAVNNSMTSTRNIRARNIEWTKILLDTFHILLWLNGMVHISDIEKFFPDNLKFLIASFSWYLNKDGYFDIKYIQSELFTSELWRAVLEKYHTSLFDWFWELSDAVKGKKWQPYFWIKKTIEDITKRWLLGGRK